MKIDVFLTTAFTKSGRGGNPAGVVINSDLTSKQMQIIAKEIRAPETAFIQCSKKGTFKIRFFTPNCEVRLCGHATIAAFYVMRKLNQVKPGKHKLETKAGNFDIYIKKNFILMEQLPPIFSEKLKKEEVADALNIHIDKLDPRLPVQIVSTGFPTIIVPIISREAMKKIAPSKNKSITLCKGKLLHLFTFDTFHEKSSAFCRNFFPIKDLDEEAATGTANAALGCYLYNHKKIKPKAKNLFFEQGYFMKKPSQIAVNLKIKAGQIIGVNVGGTCSNITKKTIII